MCVRKNPPTYALNCNLSHYNYEQCYKGEVTYVTLPKITLNCLFYVTHTQH